MKDVYNVGFIGFGMIGKVHAYGYLNLPLYYQPVPLRARVTHVCTSRAETAEAGRALLGAEEAVTDYRRITENPAIDIVHICTPNDRHGEAILSAMRHQKHIYCDKPLVASWAEAEVVRAALPAYRGTAQLTLQNRFFPATLRAKQMIDEGFLGRVLEYRAAYLHAGSADPNAPFKWKLAAGVIADLGTHVFDLMHHLLGDYAAVQAVTVKAYPDRAGAEDCMLALTRQTSGAVGTIEASKLATGSEDELRFEIHGSRGALRFNGMDAHHLEAYAGSGWTRLDTGQRYAAPAAGFPGPKFAIGWLRGHVACLAHFLQAVASGRPGEPGLSQGIYVQHVLDCASRSAREGRWVEVG
ncbi:MAG: Gfo/Idh/MocA family oxidoreductase [Lentisphaerae bacterium]|nr:Gfo/Idh/MocA family oxidoreductase [Lentisphaerota bacterium]